MGERSKRWVGNAAVRSVSPMGSITSSLALREKATKLATWEV